MFYITAYRKPVTQGHTDPVQVLTELHRTKARKITYEVASVQSLRFVPKFIMEHYVPSAELGLGHSVGVHDLAIKSDWYTTFSIPKRSGGRREIKAPNDYLKKEQRYIYEYLRNDLGILEHDCAYGFVKGRSCKQSLQVHQKNHSRWFLKLDFHNFFPSFSKELLVNKLWDQAVVARYMHHGAVADLMYMCTDENNVLVQGSPCSPYLANIAMVSFDHHFKKYCKEHGLIYTRYADDMLISSRSGFNWREVQDVVLELLENLGYNGLTLAQEKTRYGNFNGANWNLGLMYNNNFNITVGHEAKHTLKVIAHKWDTLPIEDKAHWHGVYVYYKHIEPEYFSQERFDVLNNY